MKSFMVVASVLFAPLAFVYGEEDKVRLVHPNQCVEIGRSSVSEECRRAFETRNFFEYPKSMQLYTSKPPASAETGENAGGATQVVNDRSDMEKDIQTIAVATTVTAVVSATSMAFFLLMLLKL